jgi:transcriptional regulator
MYIPGSFRQTSNAVLYDVIRQYNFAIMFSQHEGVPHATHLPFLFDENRGEYGTLMAHIARVNPHWKKMDENTEVLVVFQGPHSYISPSWYSRQETVPTWNYVAVHAYGTPTLIHEPSVLRPLVDKLVDIHETAIDSPWDRSLAEPDMDADLRAIVGLEIPIQRLEGKFKLNQNRSREDQAGVIRALEHSSDPMQQKMAEIMRENLEKSSKKVQ